MRRDDPAVGATDARTASITHAGDDLGAALPYLPLMSLAIIHHPAFDARFDPKHRFPMAKFSRLAEILVEDGIVAAGGYHVPEPAPEDWLALAHAPAYVEAVLTQAVGAETEKAIGFAVDAAVALRSRCATGGSVQIGRAHV